MTVEILFAGAAQEQAFLLLLLGGMALGLLWQLSGWLRGHLGMLAFLADLPVPLVLCGMVLAVCLHLGVGLRLYGLLGLGCGMLLYTSGIRQVIGFVAARLNRLREKRSQKRRKSKDGGELL